MSDVEQVAAPAPEAPAVEAPESFSSPSEAASFLARHAAAKRKAASETPAEGAEPAAPQEESPEGENAAPLSEAPGETTEEVEPAERPPIEPPRSWTKDQKERFASLPRETQEYIAEREQDREREFRRSQNEAAEKLKGLTAKEQAAEQARQQYEAALPALLQQLQTEMQGEFADIKTIDDVNKLAAEDPFRFAKYQAKQMQVAAIQREAQEANQRQAKEYQAKWDSFVSEQDGKFNERFPLSKDEAKFTPIMNEVKRGLKELEFSDGDLSDLWNGKSSLSLRDARLQQIIAEWAQFRLAKANATKVATKPVPPVQKPGNAVRSPNRALEAQISALEAKDSLSLKEAAQLVSLKGQRRSAA